MRRVGGLLLAMLIVAGLPGSAASAWATGPRPLDEGGMSFPEIHSSADPEEYAFTVTLGEDQVLRQIDDQTAGVFSEGSVNFSIAAEPAHDAQGATVPTTLAVSGPDLITLTVLHREGNPAAGGAPFEYPITDGTGWAGGFRTIVVPMDEPNGKPAGPAEPPAASEGVLVTRALGEDKLYYRPHFFLLSGDGTFGVSKVRWQSYGGAVAKATGRAFADDCIPNCAAGHDFRPQARLTLAKIVQCQGHPVYSRLRYQLIGKLPKGLRRRGGDPMLPLGEDGSPDC